MNQTFYIDIEEEISSVVDRLNKSMSTDNFFVVPKRALFLQSIVNLKLLKREADKVGKRVILVTQDEVGTSMAERSGIETRAGLEGIESPAAAQIQGNFDEEDVEDDDVADDAFIEQQAPVSYVRGDKKIRLSGVGSENFYDANLETIPLNSPPVKKKQDPPKRIVVNSTQKPSRMTDFQRVEKPSLPQKAAIPQASAIASPQVFASPPYAKTLDPVKEKNVERMFSNNNDQKKSANNFANAAGKEKAMPVGNEKMKRFFIGFIGLCLLAFVGIATFLFLPSAKIIITPNISKSKVDVVINADHNVAKADGENIPLRIIDREESISLSYDVNGNSAVSGKKSHGTVTIYNEFSNSAQTLIATTRLESSDGKVFRLVKNVVVPGATTVGGQDKPGAITADVTADQAGGDYNIQPSDFKIPGFKDGPKYDKFYAKSADAFVGGSSDGQTASGGAIKQSDIDSAKQKTEIALKEKIPEMLSGELADGEKDLPEAENVTIIKSAPSAKVGDIVNSFDYSVTASVHALVFSENDVKNTLNQSLKNSSDAASNKQEISKIEYTTAEPDFGGNKLNLKVHGEVTLTPNINTNQIRAELLGKTDDQLAAILKKYPAIKNANVEFKLSFMNRIPEYPQRVSVEIGNGE